MAELTQDEKSQQLSIIKEEIDKYTAHDNECRRVYDEQRKSEDRINRAVRILAGYADIVKKVDAFVGKKVWYCEHGNTSQNRVYIMTIEKVVFEKWEVTFLGQGVEICSSEHTYGCSGFSIKNNMLQKAVDGHWITESTDNAKECIIEVIAERDAAIQANIDRITKAYQDTVDALRKFVSGETAPEEHKSLNRFSRLHAHEDAVMDHVCQYSWSQLVRSFGTDADKATVEPEMVDVDTVEPEMADVENG